MAAGIYRQRPDVGRDYALIDFDPTLSVVRRAVNAAGSTYKVRSDEDGTTMSIGSQTCIVASEQTIINFLPSLAVIARSKHAKPVGTSKNGTNHIDVRRAHSSNGCVRRDGPDFGRD